MAGGLDELFAREYVRVGDLLRDPRAAAELAEMVLRCEARVEFEEEPGQWAEAYAVSAEAGALVVTVKFKGPSAHADAAEYAETQRRRGRRATVDEDAGGTDKAFVNIYLGPDETIRLQRIDYSELLI